MPKLKQFPGCRIAMYPRDHRPAHVHVEFRDGSRCTVEIDSLNVSGSIRPAARLAPAMAWIAANKATLLAKWKEIAQ
jgi:hypothetical protein